MASIEKLHLPHIEALIEEDGQITLGAMCPVGCVAIANDDHNTLALLKRRDDESLTELLLRLDAAIHNALEHDSFTDEINAPVPCQRR